MSDPILRSRYGLIVDKLLKGYTVEQINGSRLSATPSLFSYSPYPDLVQSEISRVFWTDFFFLDVDKAYLKDRLFALDRDDLNVPSVKRNISSMFINAVLIISVYSPPDSIELPSGSADRDSNDQIRALENLRGHAIETLLILVPSILRKRLTGGEIMEIFSGDFGKSRTVFKAFVSELKRVWQNAHESDVVRYHCLQIGLKFVCGVNQLSPNAYFLTEDLYPTITKALGSLDQSMKFAGAGLSLIGILSNYHRADAASLNPVLSHIKGECHDDFMRLICRVTQGCLRNAIESYQKILDDSPPTVGSSLTNALNAFVPKGDAKGLRAFGVSIPIPVIWDPKDGSIGTVENEKVGTSDNFSSQPAKVAIVLFTLHQYIQSNSSFRLIFVQPIPTLPTSQSANPNMLSSRAGKSKAAGLPPLVTHTLSLASYILTHATSTGLPRSKAYAHLMMRTIYALVDDPSVCELLCTQNLSVRLCRQRAPFLPLPTKDGTKFGFEAILDCCAIWLQHNLHRHLQTPTFILCVQALLRILGFLSAQKIRLEYTWEEIWRSLLSLLGFVLKKLGKDGMGSNTRLRELNTLIVRTLAYATAADFLPGQKDVCQLIYQLAVSSHTILSQRTLLDSTSDISHDDPKLSLNLRARTTLESHTRACLSVLERVANVILAKTAEENTRSANAVMRCIQREVEIAARDGKGAADLGTSSEQVSVKILDEGFFIEYDGRIKEDVSSDVGFVMWACADGMEL